MKKMNEFSKGELYAEYVRLKIKYELDLSNYNVEMYYNEWDEWEYVFKNIPKTECYYFVELAVDEEDDGQLYLYRTREKHDELCKTNGKCNKEWDNIKNDYKKNKL